MSMASSTGRALLVLFLATAVRAEGAAVVALDAGHGGRDQGQHLNGIYEREFALTMAHKVEAELKALGLTPFLTRWNDDYVPLSERVTRAEQVNSRVFLSFHADNNKDRKGRGVMMWVYGENKRIPKGPPRAPGERILPPPPKVQVTASRTLSEFLERGLRKRGVLVAQYVDRAGFAVLKGPAMASVLIEVGNLRDKEECLLMKDPKYQDKVAKAVAESVSRYVAAEPALAVPAAP